MVIFSNVKAEVAPEVTELFKGNELTLKATYLEESVFSRGGEKIKNIVIGTDNEAITLSGTWGDVNLVRRILEEWLQEEDAGGEIFMDDGEDEAESFLEQNIENNADPSVDKFVQGRDDCSKHIVQEKFDVGPKASLDNVKLEIQQVKAGSHASPPAILKRKRRQTLKGKSLQEASKQQAKKKPLSNERQYNQGHDIKASKLTSTKKGKPTVSVPPKKVYSHMHSKEKGESKHYDVSDEENSLEEGEIPFYDEDLSDSAMEKTEQDGLDVEDPIENEILDSTDEKNSSDEIPYNLTSEKHYACTQCQYQSPLLRNLKNHVSRVHAAKRFKCPACPKTFGLKKAYRDHYTYNHKNHKHKCTKCSKTFPRNYLLIAHLESHNAASIKKEDGEVSQSKLGGDGNKCLECDFVAKHTRYLAAHMARVHHERTLQCPHCDKKYATDRDLRWHIKSHDVNFTCHLCGKQLKTKQGLTHHLQAIHNEGPETPKKKTYLCGSCGKLCANKTVYKVHMNRAHLNIKPHTCDTCGQAFFAKASLKQHLLTHSDKRSFECDKCGKTFKQRQGLRLHKVIHRDTRPHHCTECNKSFTQHGALIRHRRIHTGERPYHCSVCEAKFSDYSILRRHLQGIHKMDNPEMVRKVVMESLNKARREQAESNKEGREEEVRLIPQRGPGGKLTPMKVIMKTESGEEVLLETDAAVSPGSLQPEDGKYQDETTGIALENPSQEITLLSQPTQLYLENSVLPNTVFVHESGPSANISHIGQDTGLEQVLVMSQAGEGGVITTTTDSKDAVLISPETLANVAAMYEHDGTIYALVQDNTLQE